MDDETPHQLDEEQTVRLAALDRAMDFHRLVGGGFAVDRDTVVATADDFRRFIAG